MMVLPSDAVVFAAAVAPAPAFPFLPFPFRFCLEYKGLAETVESKSRAGTIANLKDPNMIKRQAEEEENKERKNNQGTAVDVWKMREWEASLQFQATKESLLYNISLCHGRQIVTK